MKHLLLISNISINNKPLLEYASAFCEHYNCKLHVLHFSKNNEPVLVSSQYYYNQNNIQFSKDQLEKESNQLSAAVSQVLKKDLVELFIVKGNKEKILKSFIHDNFIDLILIANKDLENKREEVDYKNLLINIIDTPMLVVPEFEAFKPLTKFDFLTTHTEKDILDIVSLSEMFTDSKIYISHLIQEEKEQGAKVNNWKKYVESKVDNQIEFRVIKESVSDYIRSESLMGHKIFDAFVFTTKKRNFWRRLFDPSTTLGYLAGLEIPCIIFKIEE